ncbi:hypothetical protein HD554DRAFT_1651548 [Boletus coccyginus]|nr:hypothetical protein HD554DRAFT_1651548 [Boletus coccyginus]
MFPTNTISQACIATDMSSLGWDDSTSSLSRYTNPSTTGNVSRTRANTSDLSEHRLAKRRRVAGLNTRFDRMIKSVNTMLSHSPASSRKRMQSSGTSSVSSHDVPKTPVGAYSCFHPGKLGNDFSILKMKGPLLLPRDDSDGPPKPVAAPREPKNSLPDWLANTFCALEAGHPLRGLLSPSRVNTESMSNSPPVKLLGASREEELFAFSPFDKQEEAPGPAYRAESTPGVQGHVSSAVTTEPPLLRLQVEAPTNPLPFSTPGYFASVRRSIDSPVIGGTIQKSLVPVLQKVTSHATNTPNPLALSPSHVCPGDVIERRQFIQASSNIAPENELPEDLQEVGAGINDHRDQVFRVYFDSPTEDPSLSDPLQPESYELDLNAIDFRWRPFLRSNALECDTNKHSVSLSSPLGYAVPNRVGDQHGRTVPFVVDRGEYGASREELHTFVENVDTAYLDDEVRPAFASPGAFLSPLRDQPEATLLTVGGILPCGGGENIRTSDELPLLHGEETRTNAWGAHEIRPSTPIRQVLVSPPSTPQKARSSQLCEMPRGPVRKTSSALSWMIPLKSSRRAIPVRNGVNSRYSRVSANSHDSIESWSEAS